LEIIDKISVPVNPDNEDEMLELIKGSIGTKFVNRWSDLMCRLALKAIRTVSQEENGRKEVDVKRYARVEKVPGGEIEDSQVLDGIMVNKDVTHPGMRRRIENPKIILLDCPLEYKKGESQTAIEITKEADWNRVLEIEEEQIKQMCDKIIEFKPDLVFTEKGVSGAFLPFALLCPSLISKQTLHNIIFSKQTLPLFAEYENQTTTVSHEQSVQPSSTESKIFEQ